MADNPKSELSFEKGLETLEEIVKQLEGGDLPLDKSLALFEQGMALSASCRKQLEAAETKVETLVKQGETDVNVPF